MRKWIFALALVLAAALIGLPPAHAQGPINITVTQVDQSQFPQVDVYVSVTDANGNPVRNLSPNAFQVQQNGKPVNLIATTRAGEQGPVSTALVIDHSGSMAFGGKMDGAKQAAETFVNLMRPGDRTALIQFDTQIDTLQPLTSNKDALLASIQSITPRGNTALYDALTQASKSFETATGRKVIIVVTDGMDNASKLNLDDVVKQADANGFSIYTIGLGNRASAYGSQEGIDENALRQIADASMGAYYYAPDASQLSTLYQRLSLKIQNEYRLSYISPDPLRNGLRRTIVVTAPGAGTTQAAYNPGGVIPEVAPQLSSWLLFAVVLAVLVALFFAPTLMRRVTPGLAPARPPSRVKLTGGSPGPATQAPTATPQRPTRIKLGRRTSTPSSTTRTGLPWDEGTPRH